MTNVKDNRQNENNAIGFAEDRRYYFPRRLSLSLYLDPTSTLFRPEDSFIREILSLLDILDKNLQGNVVASGIFRTSAREMAHEWKVDIGDECKRPSITLKATL